MGDHGFGSNYALDHWLTGVPLVDGIRVISADRSRGTNEQSHERHSGGSSDARAGGWVLEQLNRLGLPPKASVMELACGAGQLTVGLANPAYISRLTVSDASSAFLNRARSRLEQQSNITPTEYVLLTDIDFNSIPSGAFDCIIVRGALHHYDDFPQVATALIRKLKPGGVLATLELRADFFIHAAVMLKCACARLTDQEDCVEELIQLSNRFDELALSYTSRDAWASNSQDGRGFFVEELVDIAGLSNSTLRAVGSGDSAPFSTMCLDYLSSCMGLSQAARDALISALAVEFDLIDRLFSSRTGYSAAEWFFFKKKQASVSTSGVSASKALANSFRPEIQMSEAQIEVIASAISSRGGACRLLVFGLGNDSPMWAEVNRGGRTLFVEDKGEYISQATKTIRDLEAIQFNYSEHTNVGDCASLPISALSSIQRPLQLVEYDWDVIIIDGPIGFSMTDPGRALPIFWTSQIMRADTHVFVDDYNRALERHFADKFLLYNNPPRVLLPHERDGGKTMLWRIGITPKP